MELNNPHKVWVVCDKTYVPQSPKAHLQHGHFRQAYF
jgi:hypothetical protein